MTKTIPRPPNGRFRIRAGLALASLGFIVFLIGAVPGLFGLDRSNIIGLVQIGVFLIGLGFLCIGGYITMSGLWSNVPKTIIADIGLRLVSTGYVIAFTSAMADVIGFGSQRSPEIPYFGHFQMQGVVVGEAVIALGFLLLIPYRLRRRRFRGATFIPPR
jgi:hypothetical protein